MLITSIPCALPGRIIQEVGANRKKESQVNSRAYLFRDMLQQSLEGSREGQSVHGGFWLL